MRKVVLITGTNGVGKTSAMRCLIDKCGGIAKVTEDNAVIFLADGKCAVGGGLSGKGNYYGIDVKRNTKCLEPICRKALDTCDTVFCEGAYLHTFGLNLCRALALADKGYVICLYSDYETINSHLKQRAGKGINKNIINRQRCALSSAAKFSNIGYNVMLINTADYTPEMIADKILKFSDVDGLQR